MTTGDMTTGHVFIATSLDGFVARADHRLDWLMKQKTDGEDHGYDAFIRGVEGLVMGRGTFETVKGFETWPYTVPVIVMSQTLDAGDIPDALTGKVRLSRETPAALMQALHTEGWARAYIDGGLVVQSFLREGLIAEMIITLIPILIGEGRRLFGAIPEDIDLDLLDTERFDSGLVQLRYRVRPAEDARQGPQPQTTG